MRKVEPIGGTLPVMKSVIVRGSGNRLAGAWYGSATSFINSTIRLTYAPYNEPGGWQKALDPACYEPTLHTCSHSNNHESDWIVALL